MYLCYVVSIRHDQRVAAFSRPGIPENFTTEKKTRMCNNQTEGCEEDANRE
jgi:hypothetical protein